MATLLGVEAGGDGTGLREGGHLLVQPYYNKAYLTW